MPRWLFEGMTVVRSRLRGSWVMWSGALGVTMAATRIVWRVWRRWPARTRAA